MESLLALSEPWAYVVVGGLALGEAAAFIGLFLPGETAMILGGVLAFQGRVSLGWMLASAIVGAIVGDSLGYEIGRRFGPRLEAGRIGHMVGRDRWTAARRYVRNKGGRAVFLGRFIGFLRALVPAIAGSAGIPYPTFLVFNIAGGIVWATGFILLGFAAGRSWRAVEAWAGRASLVVAGLALFVGLMVVVSRYARAHEDEIRDAVSRFLERPLLRRIRERFRTQIDFLERRLDPSSALGLYLSVALLAATVGMWLFASLLFDVLGSRETSLFDRPVLRSIVERRSEPLTALMRVVTHAGGWPVVAAAFVVAAAYLVYRRRSWWWPAFFALALAGGELLPHLIKWLVERPRPDLAPLAHPVGSSFPSVHACLGTVAAAALAYALGTGRGWTRGVMAWTAAVMVATLVSFSRLYLGVHWPTDVMAGASLGAGWVAAVAAGMRGVAGPPVRDGRSEARAERGSP